MSATSSVAEARGKLDDLVRRAARHEHITLTDEGAPVAVLMSCAEFDGLEDALALARLVRDRALGRTEAPVPHNAARRALLEAVRRGD
jgi:prevent-host-death family protein